MADISVSLSLPTIDGVAARLDPSALAALVRVAADEVAETVRDHLAAYAPVHHRTAMLLGAMPTGNLEDATVAVRPAANGAVVEVGAKGIRRALGPLVILPKNKSALTIPKHPLAYGRSVAELRSRGIKVFRPRGKNYLAYRENPKSKFSTVLYVLAKRAVLKHEPGLLPGAETLSANAARAAREFLFTPQPVHA